MILRRPPTTVNSRPRRQPISQQDGAGHVLRPFTGALLRREVYGAGCGESMNVAMSGKGPGCLETRVLFLSGGLLGPVAWLAEIFSVLCPDRLTGAENLDLYQVSLIMTHFMEADWPSRLGARRSAMRGIGQVAQRGRRAKPPHRRPQSFVHWRRCALLAVPAPQRNPRLSSGQTICGEMGHY